MADHPAAGPLHTASEQDTIIPVGEARVFADKLSAVARNRVEYSEIRRAGHAFDLVDSSHARRLAVEVGRFLNDARARQLEGETAAAV